jgi:molybdenum cofactor guanylyltransferase
MFSAAILAGGRATRFDGRDKSALVVGGRTILERQIEVLSEVAGDLMIVGGPVRPDLPVGIRQVPDTLPGYGPLGGLHAALSAARGTATVVLACDMPYVTAPLLNFLLTVSDAPLTVSDRLSTISDRLTVKGLPVADGSSHAPEADIVVPKTERGYHPLCAVYTSACLEPAARRLADGRLKLTGLFDDVRVRVVTGESLTMFGDPDRLLANVNTSIEYRAIEANGMQS